MVVVSGPEAGKRDQAVPEEFPQPDCAGMPGTMLRCAIERLREPSRRDYLKGRVRS